MTDYIVKCADVSWQRHSVSIPIGTFLTTRQRLEGTFALHGSFTDEELLAAQLDGNIGSSGVWIVGDSPHDRLLVWRPPYTCDIKRAALLVSVDIPADTSNYFNFKLLNSSDDTLNAYLYTNATALSASAPNEMTVVSTSNTVLLTQALVLQIEDELANHPIADLVLVIVNEPSAFGTYVCLIR